MTGKEERELMKRREERKEDSRGGKGMETRGRTQA